MSKHVADAMWELLAAAGVRRCYGIVGDALNPTIDALRRNGGVEFIHVRHEEYGGFAAVADAYVTGDPVAICGTAGPGVTHLINAMIDARKEGATRVRCVPSYKPHYVRRFASAVRPSFRSQATSLSRRSKAGSTPSCVQRRRSSDRPTPTSTSWPIP